MIVKRPSALFVIPVEDMREGEKMKTVLINGWDNPPKPGATCLILPIKDSDRRRQIKWLYHVTATSATGDMDWPWELGLEAFRVPVPKYWFDLTQFVLEQGLVALVGAYESGDTISHAGTIDAIYDLLGF